MLTTSRSTRSKLVRRLLFPLLLAALTAAACSLTGEEPEGPRFQPGAYGGEPLANTEALFNVRPSPDGSKVALIRERTPGVPSDPRNQLWITERDGSNPELISVTQRAWTGRLMASDWR